MKNLSEAPAETDDALQQEIVTLVRALNDLEEAVPNLNRRLCQLAREHGVAAEAFRRRLVQAGLAPARASELKFVLQAEEPCKAFLATDRPEGPQSWEVTLKQARQENLRENYGLSAADVLAAAVAGRLIRSGRISLPVAGGWLILGERSGDLESLAHLASPPPSGSPLP